MITYKKGDATRPDESPAFIVHCCNDIGAWGSGFVLALNKTFGPGPKNRYLSSRFTRLGSMSTCLFHNGPSNVRGVVNIVGQSGVRSQENPFPINYVALRDGLVRMDAWLDEYHRKTGGPTPRIVMPRIGCGLAGGSWSAVGNIVEDVLQDWEVYVYDLPGAVEGKDWNP